MIFKALDLLKKMLIIFPEARISAQKALSHKFFEEFLSDTEEEQHMKKFIITSLSDLKFTELCLTPTAFKETIRLKLFLSH